MSLPGLDSLDSVKAVYSHVRSVTWCFWALLVICEIVAHFWKKRQSLFNVLALCAFALAVGGELLELKYDQRREQLYDSREADRTKQYDQKIQQLNGQHETEATTKEQDTSLFMQAQGGDANAYDKVLEISNDRKQPLDEQWTARRTIDSIMENYPKWSPQGLGTRAPNATLADDVSNLRSADPQKRLSAISNISYKVNYISYTNAWPANSLPTYHWTEKGREELKPYIPVMDLVFEVMTKDSYLKIRVEGYKLFELLAEADRPSGTGIKILDNAAASQWWRANKKDYSEGVDR